LASASVLTIAILTLHGDAVSDDCGPPPEPPLALVRTLAKRDLVRGHPERAADLGGDEPYD
jgi:hypothetical protein